MLQLKNHALARRQLFKRDLYFLSQNFAVEFQRRV